ncbi:hypothetical protein QJS66_22280 [Kocuria rhizophila]|nr:hypothetical protein QJS66_22280 [Kocuria rhizophila]
MADLPGVELITLESVRVAAAEETSESVSAAREIVERAARGSSGQNARSIDQRSWPCASTPWRCWTPAGQGPRPPRLHRRRRAVEMAMRRMVRSLLHTPTVQAAARGGGPRRRVHHRLEALRPGGRRSGGLRRRAGASAERSLGHAPRPRAVGSTMTDRSSSEEGHMTAPTPPSTPRAPLTSAPGA